MGRSTQCAIRWGESSIQNCSVCAQFCKYSIYISTNVEKKIEKKCLENEQYLWVVKLLMKIYFIFIQIFLLKSGGKKQHCVEN